MPVSFPQLTGLQITHHLQLVTVRVTHISRIVIFTVMRPDTRSPFIAATVLQCKRIKAVYFRRRPRLKREVTAITNTGRLTVKRGINIDIG